MKANELMIGDWVRRRSIYQDTGREVVTDFQITQICKNGENLYVYGPKGNMGRVDQIEPIPLTSEILEKNGFKEEQLPIGVRKVIWESEDTRTEIVLYMDDTMPIEVRKNIYYEDEICYTLPFVWAVHQLQQVLRLCNIEKTIEL